MSKISFPSSTIFSRNQENISNIQVNYVSIVLTRSRSYNHNHTIHSISNPAASQQREHENLDPYAYLALAGAVSSSLKISTLFDMIIVGSVLMVLASLWIFVASFILSNLSWWVIRSSRFSIYLR